MNYVIHEGQPAPQRVRKNATLPIDDLKVGQGFDFDVDFVSGVQGMAAYRKRVRGKVYAVGRFELPDGTVVGRCTRVL